MSSANTSHTIKCQAILLDIEGTVSPVAFVFDVMFPYIRKNVAAFLNEHWNNASVQEAVKLVGVDVGQSDASEWLGSGDEQSQQAIVCQAVQQLMDRDAKVTGLKKLQGMIWKDGFESGELVSELFSDVLPKLKQWKAAGLDLFIYSSGSIAAQKLFFQYTTEGNLLDLFSGHFDTTSGNKKESASYRTIAQAMAVPTESICFVSDVEAELNAATEAGMQTVLRPVDTKSDSQAVSTEFASIQSFNELDFQKA